MTTAIQTAMFIAVTALVVGSAVGPRCVYAQTPAQMEYERQAREARQAEERRQQEAQRLQQLQNENARRAQEESSRAARAYAPGSQGPQSTPGSSPPSGSTGAGAAPQSVPACKAKPVRGVPAAALLISVGTVTQSGAVKPLVAQGFFLLKDSMDDALTKGGFRPPPGMSPRKGMEHARINNTPDLKQAVAALLANVVCGPVLTDPSGTAQFPPVNPGTYYLVGGNLNPRLAWNLRVDLKPGANSITLNQRNASPFD